MMNSEECKEARDIDTTSKKINLNNQNSNLNPPGCNYSIEETGGNIYKYNQNIDSESQCTSSNPCIFWKDLDTKNKYPETRADKRNLERYKIIINSKPEDNLKILDRNECDDVSKLDSNIGINFSDVLQIDKDTKPKGCFINGNTYFYNDNSSSTVDCSNENKCIIYRCNRDSIQNTEKTVYLKHFVQLLIYLMLLHF